MNIMVSEEKIQKVVTQIATSYFPEKIILFGSYAWGRPTEDSDVDFFIIKETNTPREVARKIDGSIFPRPFPLDVIVYTPKQIELSLKEGDFFIKDILTKGKILYAKDLS